MGIAFSCERCGKPFEVASELAVKRGRCSQCGHVFVIPTTARADTALLATEHDGDETFPGARLSATPRASADRLAPLARHVRTAWSGGLGVVIGFGAAALVFPASRTPFVGVIALLSFGLLFVSAVGLVVAGFGESLAQGFLCLLVPFYSWYFAVCRWTRLREFFCASLVGSVLAGVLIVTLPLLRGSAAPVQADLGIRRTDGADTTPQAADSEHERALKQLLAAVQEVGDIFHGVKEQKDYLAAVPRLEALHGQAMGLRFPRSPSEAVGRLRKLYDEPLKVAVKRMDEEALRVHRAFHVPIHIPSFQFDLDGVLNTDAFFQTSDPPRPVFVNTPPQATPSPPPPNFPAPPPTTPPPATPSGPSVTVNVSGPVDDKTRDALNAELSAIANAMKKTAGSGIGWEQTNGRLTFTVTPVDDPRAFADRITIGKVTRVEGTRIELTIARTE